MKLKELWNAYKEAKVKTLALEKQMKAEGPSMSRNDMWFAVYGNEWMAGQEVARELMVSYGYDTHEANRMVYRRPEEVEMLINKVA